MSNVQTVVGRSELSYYFVIPQVFIMLLKIQMILVSFPIEHLGHSRKHFFCPCDIIYNSDSFPNVSLDYGEMAF